MYSKRHQHHLKLCCNQVHACLVRNNIPAKDTAGQMRVLIRFAARHPARNLFLRVRASCKLTTGNYWAISVSMARCSWFSAIYCRMRSNLSPAFNRTWLRAVWLSGRLSNHAVQFLHARGGLCKGQSATKLHARNKPCCVSFKESLDYEYSCPRCCPSHRFGLMRPPKRGTGVVRCLLATGDWGRWSTALFTAASKTNRLF
jgi:hypothetical protein